MELPDYLYWDEKENIWMADTPYMEKDDMVKFCKKAIEVMDKCQR